MASQGNSGVSAILVVSALGVVAAVAVGVRFAVGGVITALFGSDKTNETDTAPVLKNHTGGRSRRKHRTPRKHRSRNGTRRA